MVTIEPPPLLTKRVCGLLRLADQFIRAKSSIELLLVELFGLWVILFPVQWHAESDSLASFFAVERVDV